MALSVICHRNKSQLNCMTLSRAQPEDSNHYITLHYKVTPLAQSCSIQRFTRFYSRLRVNSKRVISMLWLQAGMLSPLLKTFKQLRPEIQQWPLILTFPNVRSFVPATTPSHILYSFLWISMMAVVHWNTLTNDYSFITTNVTERTQVTIKGTGYTKFGLPAQHAGYL